MSKTQNTKYNKTYHIEDNRLENIAKLEFNKDSAMISCLSFGDLNFILDILYLEKLTKTYEVVSFYDKGIFIITLYKLIKEN